MNDLIRKSDADAAIVACKGNGATRQACRDAIAAIPAVMVGADAVLDAAHAYLVQQYGASPLAHPIDRARIRAALEPVAAPDLTDPVVVHANMLRGTIAKPTVEQIIHLYGREAFQPMIDAAVAKALVWDLDPGGVWNARTAFGTSYSVADSQWTYGPSRVWFWTDGGNDDAKAAAQRDYEARILAALEPVAAPELKRIGTGLYETQPAVSAPAEDAKAKGETAGETLERLGMDGAKWAAEFRTTALRLGYSDMDEGWLIGWFANAIMAGYDRKPDPAAPIRMEDMTLADLMRDPAYGAASQPDPAAIREAALREAATVAQGYHERALEWAKKVRGLERYIGETDSSRIAAAILALIPKKGTAEPTEYERKVAQMKKDFPNGI